MGSWLYNQTMRTILFFISSSIINGSVIFQWKVNPPEMMRDDWKPVNHWRYQSNDNNQKQDGHDSFVSEYSAHAQRRSFDDDDHTIIKNNILHSPSSTHDRIKWYSKLCRKAQRFCRQLHKAKTDAIIEYKEKMTNFDRNKLIQEKIVNKIKTKNPQIGHHLANNIKDYILSRLNED